MDANNSNNKVVAFDHYLELLKIAGVQRPLPDEVLKLLHTQGEMLGLSEQEMSIFDGLLNNLDSLREKPVMLYADLLREYQTALGIYDKKIIAEQLDKFELPSTLKEKLEREHLGVTLKDSLFSFLNDCMPEYEIEYDGVFTTFCKKTLCESLDCFIEKDVLKEVVFRLNACLAVRRIAALPVKVEDIEVGPTIIRVKLQLEPGERISKLQGCQDDIARELMSGGSISISNMAGTNSVQIDIPRMDRKIVNFSQFMKFEKYISSNSPDELNICVGVTTSGKPMGADLLRCHHLLIGGTTGSGKSVFLKSLILSLTLKHSPENLRMVIIDTKSLDFGIFAQLPHIDPPGQIISDPVIARRLINGLTDEIERRKSIIKDKALTLEHYNAKAQKDERIPYIVVIIDEYADLVAQMNREERADFEKGMGRIAQISRALGIRLILATQRPDATVITPLLRANFPARIAFAVVDNHNSNIIVETSGAEALLGRGDMLFSPEGKSPARLQGLWIDEDQILMAVDLMKKYYNPADSLFSKDRLSASNPYDYSIFPLVPESKLNLRPGEYCIWEFDAFVYEEKTKMERVNVGLGSAKNGLAVGMSLGESVPVTFTSMVDRAEMYLTTQRLVYLGRSVGGEFDFRDIIDFKLDEMQCSVYSVKRQNAFRFVFYHPSPTFFQNLSSLLGFSPQVDFVSAGKIADRNMLAQNLQALIYLSRSPGLNRLDFHMSNNRNSLTIRVRSDLEA